MTELKPCPKCGGRPKEATNMWDAVAYSDVTPEYCIMCEVCNYEARSDISMDDAKKKWNTLALDHRIRTLIRGTRVKE